MHYCASNYKQSVINNLLTVKNTWKNFSYELCSQAGYCNVAMCLNEVATHTLVLPGKLVKAAVPHLHGHQ